MALKEKEPVEEKRVRRTEEGEREEQRRSVLGNIEVVYDEQMQRYAITPSSVKYVVQHFYDRLRKGYPDSFSLLLLGPPGVGKSTGVREAAEEIAAQLGKRFADITSREERERVFSELDDCLVESGDLQTCVKKLNYFLFMYLNLITVVTPEELRGKPYIVSREHRKEEAIRQSPQDWAVSEFFERMELSPPDWAKLFELFPGILYLDEFTNVQREDVMIAARRLLLSKAAGFVKLNRNVLVVAAGNLPQHAPGIARPLPVTILTRCTVRYVTKPKLEDWYEWMIKRINESKVTEDKLDVTETLDFVYEYLRKNPDDFLNLEATDNLESAPTPSTWSRFVFAYPMSTLRDIAAKKDGEKHLVSVLSSMLGSAVAHRVATEFLMYGGIPFRKILEQPSELGRFIMSIEEGKRATTLIYLAAGLPMKFYEHSVSPEKAEELARELFKVALRASPDEKSSRAFACSLITSVATRTSRLFILLGKHAQDREIIERLTNLHRATLAFSRVAYAEKCENLEGIKAPI
ncbi:MAG: AAA family ATPase [Thermofilaceae archaeon]